MRVLVRFIIAILLLNISLFASNEVPTKEEVAKLYVATFNRAPDSAGLEWWTTSSGLTLEQIAQSFFDQEETQSMYPPTVTNREFVQSVYQNLFNRNPDTAGWDYWEEQLDAGAFSRNSFILAVINGALDTEVSQDATILENKNSVGLAFADAGIDDVEEAKIVMEGITADTQSVEYVISRIRTRTITQNMWDSYVADLLAGKTFYAVDRDDVGRWEILEVTFNQDLTSIHIIDANGTEEDESIKADGNKIFFLDDEDGSYSIVSQYDDYIYLDDRLEDGSKDGEGTRLYYTKEDAEEYFDFLSLVIDDFFNSTLSLEIPKVSMYIDTSVTSSDEINSKIDFDNYGFSQNSYTIDTTGIILKAEPISGEWSKIMGIIKEQSNDMVGVAVDVLVDNSFHEDRNKRAKIYMNGYNDGLRDVIPILQIVEDRVVYYQWQLGVPLEEQEFLDWETVLDGIDFNNKSVKLAIWVKDSKIHFYAECDGQIGYKTFDISGYENNPLDEGYFYKFGAEAKDGATSTTVAKFTKVYTISNESTVDDTFFNFNTLQSKAEVIKYVDSTVIENNETDLKISFYDYGFSQNSYTIRPEGITLKAEPISGEKSQIKGSLIAQPNGTIGFATDIYTADLDEDRNNRVKIYMNGYNDGTQDVVPSITIVNDKIVYSQWQSQTPDDEQTLDDWTTILDGINFSNKNIRLALWIKDKKVHFYAECDGQIGYETFDISGYENNPLQDGNWSNFRVEARDGATIATEAKFTKIYTLR